jgi:NTP pyrophosphatase (non-canonical NTP hydrolase)
MNQQEIIIDSILQERIRQDDLHQWTVKTNRLAVLVEEVGEVASALQGDGDLEEELMQLASVCLRWLEEL